jgi:hypothetical protein
VTLRPKPRHIQNVLTPAGLKILQNELCSKYSDFYFEKMRGRYVRHSDESPHLKECHEQLLTAAKQLFSSETLVPSYAFFAYYRRGATLPIHKDTNACTYTIDLCVYQNMPWDLIVEGTPYTLSSNEAIAYYGEDQEHGRPKFPSPDGEVAMAFFHFVEPDHWYVNGGIMPGAKKLES